MAAGVTFHALDRQACPILPEGWNSTGIANCPQFGKQTVGADSSQKSITRQMRNHNRISRVLRKTLPSKLDESVIRKCDGVHNPDLLRVSKYGLNSEQRGHKAYGD